MPNTMPLPPFERPVRLPASVECLVAEPPVAQAGAPGRWLLRFALSEDVPAGTEIRVLFDGGRNVKGAFRPIQVTDPQAPGYVSVSHGNAEPIAPLQLMEGGLVAFRAPESGLTADERLQVELTGASAPQLDLLSKLVLLYLPLPDEHTAVPVINAEAAKRVIGACLLHVTGNSLAGLRIHAPSQIESGQPFSLLVRGEDEYRNVACERPGELVVSANGQVIEGWQRRDLQPAACAWLTGIVLDEPGVVRLAVEDTTHGLRSRANPTCCTAALTPLESRHYWGMIHGHTELSDGAGSLDHYFTYMRDQCALDFGALGDHDHLYETSDEMWAMSQAATRRYHDPGRFVTFLGYEWAKWRQNGDGDRNVYFLHDDRPMYRSDNGEYPTPADLFTALASETAMVIPHHPANIGNHCDWKDHDPAREHLVEIFSEWGSSEGSVNEGNPYPMHPSAAALDKADSGEQPEGFVQRGLALGWRVGFTGGGDDHMAHPGDVTVRWSRPPRAPGLLAVRATGRSRQEIWDALYRRDCYGTTGARIIVAFTLDGAPMGAELWLSERPELAGRRRLRVEAHGTDVIAEIAVVRNNETVFTHNGHTPDESFEWEDAEPFEAIALPPAQHWPTPFCFYYLRLRQADGEMAWISPIWVSPRP